MMEICCMFEIFKDLILERGCVFQVEAIVNVKDCELDLNRVCWESRFFDVFVLRNEEVGISEGSQQGNSIQRIVFYCQEYVVLKDFER